VDCAPAFGIYVRLTGRGCQDRPSRCTRSIRAILSSSVSATLAVDPGRLAASVELGHPLHADQRVAVTSINAHWASIRSEGERRWRDTRPLWMLAAPAWGRDAAHYETSQTRAQPMPWLPTQPDDGQGGLGQLRRGLGGVEDDRAGGQGVDRGPAGVDPLLAPGPHPPPTTNNSPRPSPATAAAPNCCSRSSPNARRRTKNSVAIASNESFGGWTKTFTDPRLCAAIVDRLTFGGNIIETGTDSYRLARTEPSPPPEPAPPDVTIHEHRSCSKRSTDAEIHEQTTPPLTDIAKHPTHMLGDMTIQRMDHVGVVVDDLEAAIAFFVELGMELEDEAPVEGRWVDRVVGLDDVRVDIAMMRTPDGHGRLELTKFHTSTAVRMGKFHILGVWARTEASTSRRRPTRKPWQRPPWRSQQPILVRPHRRHHKASRMIRDGHSRP
jgi:catechol 2,3-dioxygenase-like lactoylglutathione lyase family enzyme